MFAVSVLSAGFHEFGHAAAARYSGAQPGVIGAGLYLVWPAFYTDVTDSYRLGRAGRIRTDLGGLYFNAIVVVLTFAWWYYTGWDALLLLVATQVMQMVQQLLPLLRFDGYHLLADLAGVPDLYHRIRPTLLGLLPHRWFAPENRVLKPWSRAVITFWVLITIPMMALMLYALVKAVPRLVGTAWQVMQEDAAGVTAAWRNGGMVDASAHVLELLGVVLAMLACVLILGRIGLRSSRGLARWSRGSFLKRVVAAAVSTVAITSLVWAWSPQPGTYEPISPDEQGLLSALLPASSAGGLPALRRWMRPRSSIGGGGQSGASAEQRLASGAPLEATFPEGAALPTEAEPQLAMVLVPTEDPDGDVDAPPATDGSDEPWVFPFDKPLPPAEGDNQALAVNTTDGSTKYDVAFALVWAEGDEVLNVNEAHAYASCSNCVTVAVAFQVVLIMDDAQVVVPQNLAVAANYECYRCITAAIASQLVLSVEETPGQEQLLALVEVWNRLTEFGQNITAYSLWTRSPPSWRSSRPRSSPSSTMRPRSYPIRRRHRHPGRRPTAPPPTEAANPHRPARRPAHPPAHRPHHHPANRRRASRRRSRRPSRRQPPASSPEPTTETAPSSPSPSP